VNYFLVVWLPFYLVNEVHLTMRSMARTAGVYYLIEGTAALTAGSMADAFIRRGHTPSLVRKSIMALGCVTSAAGLCCCAVLGPRAYLASMLVVVLGGGIFSSGVFAMSQTLAGPLAAGQWVGLQNALGNFAGIIGPALTGLLVERTGSFTVALAIAAGVVLLGAVAWVFLIGPLRQVTWEAPGPAAAVDVGSPA
jgi:MFS family permease